MLQLISLYLANLKFLVIKWLTLKCVDINIELVTTGSVAGHRIRTTASVRFRTVEGCYGIATRRVSLCIANRPAVFSTEWPQMLVALRCGVELRFVSSRDSLEMGAMI